VDGAWDAEAISEEAVIGYAEFTAGLEQAEDSVASGLTDLADGSSGDFSLGDDGADVVFRSIGVKRDFRACRGRAEDPASVGEGVSVADRAWRSR